MKRKVTPRLTPTISKFLLESNHIENEYSAQAYQDAKKAWKFLVDKELTITNLLYTHKILMQNLRPDIAGKFRNCDVWIGGERKKFIHESKFKEDLLLIFKAMEWMTEPFENLHQTIEAKKQNSRILHVQFEKVHPFEDGNGRIGRILYNIHRQRLGLPIHIIHVGEEQYEYYKWFSNNHLKDI